MSYEEQSRLFNQLPKHLLKMALFKVNTGCREAEVCALKWNGKSRYRNEDQCFYDPPANVKNRQSVS